MTKVNTEEIIVTKEEREALIGRVEVLQKVKDLLLLPGLEAATTKQVARFYEVSHEAIRKVVSRHGDELQADGMHLEKYSEIKEKVTVKHVPLLEAGVSYRGTNLFPKRAILRIGMLLRDSKIAKAVREQLLNIEEMAQGVAPEIVTAHVNHETVLAANVFRAIESKDSMATFEATRELYAYRNRKTEQQAKHYESLEDVVDTMSITDLCRHNLKGRITPQKANKILLDLGIYESVKVRGSWIPAPKYKGTWFRLVQQPLRFSAGEVTAYRITLEGAEEITKLLKQHLMREVTQAA